VGEASFIIGSLQTKRKRGGMEREIRSPTHPVQERKKNWYEKVTVFKEKAFWGKQNPMGGRVGLA